MKKAWFFMALLVVLATSVSGVLAQQPGPPSKKENVLIFDVEYNLESESWSCLNFSLEVVGLAGQELRVSAFPYYLGTGEYIPNISGEEISTSPSGYTVGWFLLDIESDPTVWNKAEGGYVNACINNWHLPIISGGFEMAIYMELTNEATGELLASFDAGAEIGAITVEEPTQLISVTNLQYDFEASITDDRGNQIDGMLVSFALHFYNFQDVSLDVVLLPVEATEHQYISSVKEGISGFITNDGLIVSYDSVVPPYQDSLWSPTVGGQFFSLFLPYANFPAGNYFWYPEINVFDTQSGDLLFQYFGGEYETVEMK